MEISNIELLKKKLITKNKHQEIVNKEILCQIQEVLKELKQRVTATAKKIER